MKMVIKILLILLLIYALLFQSFTGVFDFLNKNKDMGFWTSFFESDLPNVIGVFSIGYVICYLVKMTN